MKYVYLIIFVFIFIGCEVPEKTYIPRDKMKINQSERFILEKVQSFKEDNSYSGSRDVYILTDTKTDIKYIGISGVGISELGSHTVGKIQQKDER